MINSVPFYSQIPNWNGDNSGFPSIEDANHWRPRGCGIACFRMVVACLSSDDRLKKRSYWNWICEGLDRRAYCDKGWIHDGLRDMAIAHGIESVSHRGVNLEFVKGLLAEGWIIIASVSVGFRGGETREDGTIIGKGGHLALAIGCNDQGIVFNHPSAKEERNWKGVCVDYDKVQRSFSNNCIAFR